nr:immunoglobulin light chain junction region [Macaca mulatta]MOW56411.1 immunoglobulin light chain junction region [Macaca mulatta]MOW56509.1 immunoglobulin light chain junction region [Macaca mulatta]MOW56535.1 immunoglobulin light chain junction region [Macaca mulatta]MOW56563.1 immunoglobulin light chain junction region [Macaca mulatta]
DYYCQSADGNYNWVF